MTAAAVRVVTRYTKLYEIEKCPHPRRRESLHVSATKEEMVERDPKSPPERAFHHWVSDACQ
ncbi:MAG: uncharacterized protein KVP18_000494 [Porospora cf. gigantea A]|uniref:uncharacterized protein n=1 Tax=Porospora cf. gigantea A TaxID=2853593 RepID=UPI0035598168|nr:MAG: hypothetical protein KVP18_000494 [Porospora cf. gigantea A]